MTGLQVRHRGGNKEGLEDKRDSIEIEQSDRADYVLTFYYENGITASFDYWWIAFIDSTGNKYKGACAQKVLGNYRGMVVSDVYSGYNMLSESTRAGYWAHARRKWDEAMPEGAARPKRMRWLQKSWNTAADSLKY